MSAALCLASSDMPPCVAPSVLPLQLVQYEVTGRKRPTVHLPKPSIFKMTIYAPDAVTAKSRFW